MSLPSTLGHMYIIMSSWVRSVLLKQIPLIVLGSYGRGILEDANGLGAHLM